MKTVMIMSGSDVLEMETIEFEGRYWLVPNWFLSPDGQTMRPLRIIAPRFAPGYKPIAGLAALEIFRALPLPKTLLEQGVIPSELSPVVEVRESPDIVVPNPDVLQ